MTTAYVVMGVATFVALTVLYGALSGRAHAKARAERSAPDDAAYEAQQRLNRAQQTPEEDR